MLIKASDFAKAAGLKPATLRQHISRKKVFRSKGFIDTDFAPNREYIMDQTDGKGLNMKLIPKKGPAKSKKTADSGPDVEGKDASDAIGSPKTEKFDTLGMQKKALEIKKIERDNEIKQLQIQKLRGQLMPIDLVESILTVNVSTIIRDFESTAENVASTYCDILGGDRSHMTEMTKQMREMLQKSIEQVKEQSAKEIKVAIRDYSKSIGRGNKK